MKHKKKKFLALKPSPASLSLSFRGFNFSSHSLTLSSSSLFRTKITGFPKSDSYSVSNEGKVFTGESVAARI